MRDNNDGVIIRNVRLQSNAGWYLGSIEFYNFEEANPYSRETDWYYPDEEMLKADYPKSISFREAFDKIKHDRLYRSSVEKYMRRTGQ